jgi:hypothetical protein
MGSDSVLRWMFYSPSLLTVIPLVGLALAVCVGLRWRCSLAVRVAAVVAGLAGAGYLFWAHRAIATSHSSTAAIGYIYMPQMVVIVCGGAFLVAWAAAILVIRWIGAKTESAVSIARDWPLYAAGLVLVVFAIWGSRTLMRDMELSQARSSSSVEKLADLCELALQKRDGKVLAALATNPNARGDMLERIYTLATSGSRSSAVAVDFSRVVIELARNANTPAAVLRSMYETDGQSYTKYQLVENPSTPQDVLEKLAVDSEPGVRSAVCRNPKTSRQMLEQLGGDPDKRVKMAAEAALMRRQPRVER